MSHSPANARSSSTPQVKTISRWLPRLRKGGFAVLDRALFAGTNFLINILLARWLSPEEYGAFAVAYSIFLLMGSFHSALLTGPMLVFGAGKYFEQLRRYMGFLLVGQAVYSVIIALAAIVAAFVYQSLRGSVLMAESMLALAATGPMILLLWLTRRAFYVDSRPHWAASGGIVYLVLLVSGTTLLRNSGQLSSGTALLAMGFSSLISSLWLVLLLKPKSPLGADDFLRSAIGDHWRYGRWSTASWALQWFPQNIYYQVLPIMVGLAGAGTLRAVMNLAMPILQTNGAIAMLLGPTFVRALKHHGPNSLDKRVRFGLLLFFVTSLVYGVIVLFCGEVLIDLVYNGQYTDVVTPATLALVALLPLSAGLMAVFTGALNAIEHFRAVFFCYVAASLTTLTIGLGLLATGGVTGAIGGLLASSLATMIAAAVFYRRDIAVLRHDYRKDDAADAVVDAVA